MAIRGEHRSNDRAPICREMVSNVIVYLGVNNTKGPVCESRLRKMNIHALGPVWRKFSVLCYHKEQLWFGRSSCYAETRRQDVVFRKVAKLDKPVIYVGFPKGFGEFTDPLAMFE